MIRSWCIVLQCFALVLSSRIDCHAAEYQIGCAKSDVTGPPFGVQLFGYAPHGQFNSGQESAGIHFRQWSRAFVAVDSRSGKRFALASVDICNMTHAIHLSVVDRLREQLGDLYTMENTILCATHTHAAPGGYDLEVAEPPLSLPFLVEYYDVIVSGIAESIIRADRNLAEGEVEIHHGIVEGAGANRSVTAYMNNPESERAQYDSDTDKEMTLLKFSVNGQPVGTFNWFPVHPTGMSLRNRLISGDIKGYGSYLLESQLGDRDGKFVAACAQSNCGDVTPNLNLNQTGPGRNEFDKTRIITQRQVDTALDLFRSANKKLSGSIDYRFAYINFVDQPVDEKFAGQLNCRTCPSAMGYAAAAGSTEDGGGYHLFHEGMRKQNLLIDSLAKWMFGLESPSPKCRACHGNKAILVASGEAKPHPARPQTVPVTLVKFGQLAILAVPAEFTTMSGRRLRNTVAEILDDSIHYLLIAGYANGHSGYVTTKEEYDMQQYEGGQTLFGPWTLAAYQQQFARLAESIRTDSEIGPGPMPRDLRGTVNETKLASQVAYRRHGLGSVLTPPKPIYSAGNIVEVVFSSAHPHDTYPQKESFFRIERQQGSGWIEVANDDDWQTQCHWSTDMQVSNRLTFSVVWEIPEDVLPGTYRIGHFGLVHSDTGDRDSFSGYCAAFQVR